jgi:hypothetical protein
MRLRTEKPIHRLFHVQQLRMVGHDFAVRKGWPHCQQHSGAACMDSEPVQFSCIRDGYSCPADGMTCLNVAVCTDYLPHCQQHEEVFHMDFAPVRFSCIRDDQLPRGSFGVD